MTKKRKKKDSAGKKRPLYQFLYPVLAYPIRWFCRVRCTGLENIPQNGACLVCSNHISNIDALLLGALFPRRRPLRFLAKAELFRVPIVRGFVKGLGAVCVDRKTADVSAIRKSIEVLNGGEVLAVFPQGTRCMNKDPATTPIHAGAGMLVAKTGCTVLPISIRTKNMYFRPFRRVYVTVGRPIAAAELLSGDEELHSKPDYGDITRKIYTEILHLGAFLPMNEGYDDQSSR